MGFTRLGDTLPKYLEEISARAAAAPKRPIRSTMEGPEFPVRQHGGRVVIDLGLDIDGGCQDYLFYDLGKFDPHDIADDEWSKRIVKDGRTARIKKDRHRSAELVGYISVAYPLLNRLYDEFYQMAQEGGDAA